MPATLFAQVASRRLRQIGQYQGAGVFTGFALLLRHVAQRNRLPFTAVLGRRFLPVLRMCFATESSPIRPYLESCRRPDRRACQ